MAGYRYETAARARTPGAAAPSTQCSGGCAPGRCKYGTAVKRRECVVPKTEVN